MNGQVKSLAFEIATSPSVVGLTLEEIPCIIPDVIPPQTYIMNLEQSQVQHQLIQINKDDAQLLGLCNSKKNNFLMSPFKQHLEENAVLSSKFNSNMDSSINLKLLNNSVIITSDSINNCSFPKKKIMEKPLGSCENPIEIIQNGGKLQSTQNLSEEHLQQIAEALQQFHPTKQQEEEEDPSQDYIYEYEIVYPDELDIKPLLATHPKKAKRPKKRSVENTFSESEEPIVLKKVKTRSGRITRPPRYIEKDFKAIETDEAGDTNTIENTLKLEPLKENQNNEPIQRNIKEYQTAKKHIPAQYRCPKCKKAYLGHNRILKHLEQNPSHGKLPDSCKPLRDNQTWNFLINLALKCPIGKRGIKFCNELTNLLKNAKELAKNLFKQPLACDRDLFYIDKELGAALEMECGKYSLNEAEIMKDSSIFSFLDSFIEDKEPRKINNDINVNNSYFKNSVNEPGINLNIVNNNFDKNSNSLDTLPSSDTKRSLLNTLNEKLVCAKNSNEVTSNLLTDFLKTENQKFPSTFEKCLTTDVKMQCTDPNKILNDVSLKKNVLMKRNANSIIRKRLKKKIVKNGILSEQKLEKNTAKKGITCSKSSQIEVKNKNTLLSSLNSPNSTEKSKFIEDSVFNFCKLKVENTTESLLESTMKSFKVQSASNDLLDSSLNPSDYEGCTTPDLNLQTSQILVEAKAKNKKVENYKQSIVNFVESINLNNNHQFVTNTTDTINRSTNDSPERGEFEILNPCKSISINLQDNKQDSNDFALLGPVIKQENSDFHRSMSLSSDLLVENSLLNTPEDLMTLSNVPSFLDNSASSYEILNVDQFVNERFKNITEPELDLGNPSINLDLQTMDLFPFGSS